MRARVPALRIPLSLAICVALVLAALACSVVVANALDDPVVPMRVQTMVPAEARRSARPLVLTLGGPVYCGQSAALARYLGASLLCPDYGADGERSGASRARRVEDWGDPTYLAAVAGCLASSCNRA